ncbi:hypothetical protein QYM36_013316, partial [Artemia franciscana]
MMELPQTTGVAEVTTVSESVLVKCEVEDSLASNGEELFDNPNLLSPKCEDASLATFLGISGPSKLELDTEESVLVCFDNEEMIHSKELKSHQRINKRKKQHTCDICQKNLSSSYNLKLHQSLHTGEGLFKCDVCKKCFTTSSSLNIHQRVHTGAKPFQCDVCNKCFSHS